MRVRVVQGEVIFCDMGPNQGMHRVSMRGYIYLTDAELELYQKHGIKVALTTQLPGDTKPQECEREDEDSR